MVELREREPGHGLRVQIEAYVLDPPTKTPLFEYTSRPTRDVISSGTAFIFDTVTSAPNKRSLSNDARQTVPATFSVAPRVRLTSAIREGRFSRFDDWERFFTVRP